MEILSKDTIYTYILPNLQIGSAGKYLELDFTVEIVQAVLYRLKTDVQWHFLPVKAIFTENVHLAMCLLSF